MHIEHYLDPFCWPKDLMRCFEASILCAQVTSFPGVYKSKKLESKIESAIFDMHLSQKCGIRGFGINNIWSQHERVGLNQPGIRFDQRRKQYDVNLVFPVTLSLIPKYVVIPDKFCCCWLWQLTDPESTFISSLSKVSNEQLRTKFPSPWDILLPGDKIKRGRGRGGEAGGVQHSFNVIQVSFVGGVNAKLSP